ncbi:MAG: hypothetical protein IPJ08_18900 [Burkholderiales bacterium]|nr:hypothetical protein [Burkholderiales bacterium]
MAEPACPGLVLQRPAGQTSAEATRAVHLRLLELGLGDTVQVGVEAVATKPGHEGLRLALRPQQALGLAPGHDTLGLHENLAFYGLDARTALMRETLLAMLLGPQAAVFPSVDEWWSAVRMRVNVAQAARRTQLSFSTADAERPDDCWAYHRETGFTIRPGSPLIDALRKTTQPEDGGLIYSFSCYRATEYVLLLGLAEELSLSNPALLAQLQARWERKAIQSGLFHDVFLKEEGSLDQPLPPRYYVPGDRVWFRNPDEASSDASGYEGSWTLYLGQGEFANLWHRERPFTLASKGIEVYHWRDALYFDEEGEQRIDEDKVAACVAATEADPVRREQILRRMLRLRDGKGVYADGGCIDATREHLRWVQPSTTDLVVPAA